MCLGDNLLDPALSGGLLVVGPPWPYSISSPKILETTWTGDNIDTMRHLAADRHGQGKPSWVVGGGDDGGKETFIADLAYISITSKTIHCIYNKNLIVCLFVF